MNKKENATLRCMRCDNEFEAEIWTAIDVSDEDLNHMIFTDQINIFTCEKCGSCGATAFTLQVRDKKAKKEALVMPLYQPDKPEGDESNPAFSVVEIQKKRPCKMFYDLSELKFEIHSWSGEPFISFEAPPDEKDIEEGLAKGFISEKEGDELRNADWDAIYDKMIEEGMIEKKPVDLEDEENDLVELYCRLMTQLKRSRTVVELRNQSASVDIKTQKEPDRERVDSLGWKWSKVNSLESYLKYIEYAAFVFGDPKELIDEKARILREIKKKKKKTEPTKKDDTYKE